MVNCYAWYTVSERGGTSPPPPLQRGEERKRRGDVIPSKRGECSAVSRQHSACGMPCRGEPLCSPFFCVVSGYPNANFANEREWTQIHINERKVKSEKWKMNTRRTFRFPITINHWQLTINLSFRTPWGIPRGKGKEILRFALNDKSGQFLHKFVKYLPVG